MGGGDAAVVPERIWKAATDYRAENPMVNEVWNSPPFCHCTFTAAPEFDAELGSRFTQIVINMDPNDPLVAELNRLESARGWVRSRSEGFEALYEALQEKNDE